jgi:hypothetical protein
MNATGYAIQVFYKNQSVDITLQRSDNFRCLREKVLRLFGEYTCEQEASPLIFTMDLASLFCKQYKRSNYNPQASDIVYDAVRYIENSFVGRVTINLIDIRGLQHGSNFAPPSSSGRLAVNLFASSDISENLGVAAAPSGYGEGASCFLPDAGCTSWADSGYNSLGGGLYNGTDFFVNNINNSNSGSFQNGAERDAADAAAAAGGGVGGGSASPNNNGADISSNSGSSGAEAGAALGDGGLPLQRLFGAPSLQDSLFAELSASSVIQGRLFKKDLSSFRRQEIWK